MDATSTSMATSNDPARAPFTLIAERAAATLTIPGFVDFLVAEDAAVWVTNVDRIERLERGSATPTATVPVPAPCGIMAVGFGTAWVANCRDGAVCRVDPVCASSPVCPPAWQTPRVNSASPLALARCGCFRTAPASCRGSIRRPIRSWRRSRWRRIRMRPRLASVQCGSPTRARRTLAASGRRNALIPTPIRSWPRSMWNPHRASWPWAQAQPGHSTKAMARLSRIDPSTNRVSATIAVTGAAGGGGDIAVGAGRVWVRTTQTLLSVIDADTNTVAEILGPPAGSGAGVCRRRLDLGHRP